MRQHRAPGSLSPLSAPVDDRVLAALPEVAHVTRTAEEVMVAGTNDVLGAVIAALARDGIVAERLRVERTSLEDAFITLTAQ